MRVLIQLTPFNKKSLPFKVTIVVLIPTRFYFDKYMHIKQEMRRYILPMLNNLEAFCINFLVAKANGLGSGYL